MLIILSKLVASMIALSVSVERIIEILKGLVPTFPLFVPKNDPVKESRRVALIHIFSGVLGGLIARLTSLQIITWDPKASLLENALLAGLFASAGSAFWNHILDILKAIKIQSEAAAKVAVARAKDL